MMERALPRSVQGIFNWLYKLPDEQITEILSEAMLDPAMAKRLMQSPTANNLREINYGLKDRLQAGFIGTGTGLMGEASNE